MKSVYTKILLLYSAIILGGIWVVFFLFRAIPFNTDVMISGQRLSLRGVALVSVFVLSLTFLQKKLLKFDTTLTIWHLAYLSIVSFMISELIFQFTTVLFMLDGSPGYKTYILLHNLLGLLIFGIAISLIVAYVLKRKTMKQK